jgi:SAM-dependent methyltransferase
MTLSVDLTHRRDEPEWLDRTDLDPNELESVLRDLSRFNQAFLGHYPLLRWLGRAIGGTPKVSPLTIVDVGCGYGDLLRAIRRWSQRRRLELNLVGIDLNPETVRIARAATSPAERIDFQVMDIFEFNPTVRADFIVSSLVTHHLSDDEISAFLHLMETLARRGWALCDLQRSRFLYHFIGLSSRLARLHPMITHDGQISVARSLKRAEWVQRIAAAGLPPHDAEIRWFLFRFLIGRLRRAAQIPQVRQ